MSNKMSSVDIVFDHHPTKLKRKKLPRRKVVRTFVGYLSWNCELSCGHFMNTGQWATRRGGFRPAPKTMACTECFLALCRK